MREDKVLELLGLDPYDYPRKAFEVLGYSCCLESNLSRVRHHLQKGSIAISACRNDFSFKENVARTNSLMQEIRDLGYGFIPLVGGYREKINDTEEVDVTETSFLVPYIEAKGTFKEFIAKFHSLANRFNQDSILVTEPTGEIYYLDKTNTVDASFGKVKFDVSKAEYFSMLAKGNHRNRKWVFEGVAVPNTLYSKHAASKKGMLHVVKGEVE